MENAYQRIRLSCGKAAMLISEIGIFIGHSIFPIRSCRHLTSPLFKEHFRCTNLDTDQHRLSRAWLKFKINSDLGLRDTAFSRIAQPEERSRRIKRFKNILYVADPVVELGEAFERAVALAEKTGAQLTIAEVSEPIPSFVTRKTPYKLREIVTRHRDSELKKICQSVGKRIKIEAKILEGKFFLEIVREVLRNGRDLVIKPAEGGSIIGRLFGSNDMHLLRKCPCPVWLIKIAEDRSYRNILAAVDLNEDDESEESEALNRQILELALSLAHSEKSELHVCHAWYPPYENMMKNRTGMEDEEVEAYVEEVHAHHQQWLNRLMGLAKKWTREEIYDSVQPNTHLSKGDARNVIPELARELHADLVVMGTVARTGISGLLIGNTAESILDQLDCSVLAVKPQGFISPVALERVS